MLGEAQAHAPYTSVQIGIPGQGLKSADRRGPGQADAEAFACGPKRPRQFTRANPSVAK